MTVEYTLLALAVPALLAAAGFAVWTRLRTRRMLDTLGKMLDDAIRGEFRESLYDESRLSALETRMAHYLSASAVSAKNLAEEKDAIKTLIGDISHRPRLPSPTSCCMPSCWRSRTCRRRAGSMSPLWSIRRRSCGSSSTRWSKPPG